MDSTVATINNHKENHFDFDMTVDGLNAEEADVRFVIKYQPGFCLSFCAEHESGSKWTVEIPALPMLETTGYNFVIEVVIDGYHFEGMRGMLNVIGAPGVYVSKPETKTTKTTEPTTEQKKEVSPIFTEKPKTKPTRQSEKTIAMIAEELTATPVEKKPKPAAKKVEKKTPAKKVEKKINLTEDIKKIMKTEKPEKKVAKKKTAPTPKKPAKKPAAKIVSETPSEVRKVLESLEPANEPEKTTIKKKIVIKKGEQVVR